MIVRPRCSGGQSCSPYRVRLSAGRRSLSQECVTLCFLAGANSIFVGDKLLTTPNPNRSEDMHLLEELDLIPTGQ